MKKFTTAYYTAMMEGNGFDYRSEITQKGKRKRKKLDINDIASNKSYFNN